MLLAEALFLTSSFGLVVFSALAWAHRPGKFSRLVGGVEGEAHPASGARRRVPARLPSSAVAASALLLFGLLALAGDPALGAFLAACVCLAPRLAARAREALRREAVVSGLEGVCGVMATALRAGQDVMSAVEGSVKYARPPLKRELEELVAEVKLGRSLGEAVENFARKWPSPETRLLAYAVTLAQRMGGQAVPKALLSVTSSVRERLELKHQVRAKTTYQRVSAVVVGAVPLWCLGVMWFLNPGFLGSLLETPGGRACFTVGVALLVVGWLLAYAASRAEEF
ncbi:Type II secretion system F domain protein [Ammonifex degensii KC4]|uniref:Type II secretion system F domain protein n=1 Tax=Ammonifex degensii (strain DSM 10501 / KC4) TaxID=429009 RepID=C9RCE7_AMMDK|nr:Type II secretion system F domain protein [Ammonifex degensii KC4]